MKGAMMVAAIVLVAISAMAGLWFWNGWQSLDKAAREDAPFSTGAPIFVEVEAGLSARAIIRQLVTAGTLPNTQFPEIYYRFALDGPPLQAGEYSFSPEDTPRTVFDKLIRGDVVTRPLVIIEGLTAREIAAEVEKQGFASADGFLAAATPDLIGDLDPTAPDLEGYLFPDTYRFPRTVTAPEIVATMVESFRSRTAELREDPSLPPVREWVTLASIVEKETQVDRERPLVAGVYRNRLDRGIGLYADPTIIYALKLDRTWDGDLKRSHLEMESPWNTYLIPGLPPGPICSPGLASLRAAAAPSEEPYLYFVSRNDGTHVFATTLREHNRNVNEWQREYWRRKRQNEAADDSG